MVTSAAAGAVTAAHAGRRAVAALAYALPLAPLAVVAVPLHARAPGTQAAAGDVLGLAAALSLLACLAVTPLTRVTKFKGAARYRRHYGLCVFILGGAGFAIAAAAGPGTGHAQEWTGTAIVALLAPVALISNQAATKLLGTSWKPWQRRLTWAAWAMLAVHLVLLRAWVCEAAYLAASAPLLAARLPAARKGLPRWRRQGYPGWLRRAAAGMTAAVFLAGMTGLTWLEVTACTRAVQLA